MGIHRFLYLEIRECFSAFWGRNPALFLGFSLLLGTAVAFHPHPLLFALFFFLCFSSRSKSHLILALSTCTLAFALATVQHPKIALPKGQLHGKGHFHIQQIKHHSSPFHRSLLYTGTLKQFIADDGQVFKNLPCNLYLPVYGKHLPATVDYEICGFLSQKADHFFILKPDKKVPWKNVASSFNLSEWRFHAKQAMAKYLKKEIPDQKASIFLNALTTGELDERILKMEFGKVGLQHILAISGFHFALAALFLNFLFRLFLPYKVSAGCLIASLTLYYVFLGNAPSIQRAYIAISMIALSQLFSWRISGLNALGTGIIVELLFDPLVVTQLGFQLTFLCTLAILLFYPALHRVLEWVLPSRNGVEIRSMPLLDQHGYMLCSILRKSLALNFAVHLISLPVILHLFHKFPLLSIVYNLFFPACVALSMLLLFTALFFAPWVPFFSHALHTLNNAWTSSVLTMTSNPPALLDFSLRTKHISFSFILCFLAISLFFGILFYEKKRSLV